MTISVLAGELVYSGAALLTMTGIAFQIVGAYKNYHSSDSAPIAISARFLILVMLAYVIYATYALILILNSGDSTGIAMLFFSTLGFIGATVVFIYVLKKNKKDAKQRRVLDIVAGNKPPIL